MKNAYDRNRAQLLVPLLEAISQELVDRTHEIRVLQGRISHLEENDATGDFFQLKAELATHRREVRLTLKELERLGCVVDEENPLRIFIPGSDGNLDDGYQWEASEPTLRPMSSETTGSSGPAGTILT